MVVVEPNAARRELAGAMGADRLVDPGAEDALAAVRAETSGRGADVALEAAGPTAAQRLAVESTRRGGRTVLTGFELGGAELALPQVETALQSRQILSSQNGQVHMRSDLQRYAGMLERGLLDPTRVLTARYPLAQLDLARDRSESLDDICGVIVFD